MRTTRKSITISVPPVTRIRNGITRTTWSVTKQTMTLKDKVPAWVENMEFRLTQGGVKFGHWQAVVLNSDGAVLAIRQTGGCPSDRLTDREVRKEAGLQFRNLERTLRVERKNRG